MWEIFSEGVDPYWEYQRNIKEITVFVVKGGRLSKPEKCPEEVWNLMISCWVQKPSERPSFDTLETSLSKLVNPSVTVTTGSSSKASYD